MCLVLLASCGDDAEDTFCEAGDSLRDDVASLSEVDVLADGLSAFDEPVEAIRVDVEQLRDSATDVAADEIAALESAISDLGDALTGLSEGVSVDDAQALGVASGDVAQAANAVFDRLANTCD